MDMRWRPVMTGGMSLIPGMNWITGRDKKTGTGGTVSSIYCYDLWLKHLTLARENGLRAMPKVLVEFGAGDSIGTGLAAMLSGVNHYKALDIIAHANIEANLDILEDLVTYFMERKSRTTKGWPDYDPYMQGKLFPYHILTDSLLGASLSPERVARIRHLVSNPEYRDPEMSIEYVVPWTERHLSIEGSVDMILSHSCMEHVDDIDSVYQAMAGWCNLGGFMSHQIDYTSHGLSRRWNGYRTCPEWAWKLARGRDYYLINREPHSRHLACISKYDFQLVCNMRFERRELSVERSSLTKKWKWLDDEDLYCSQAFVQATRR